MKPRPPAFVQKPIQEHPVTHAALAHTCAVAHAEELALVRRSGFVESRHIGSAVVTGPDGKVMLALGDPVAPVFARSTLKPLQALGCLRAGAPLEGDRLAIAAGSHTGERRHRELVTSMLTGAGLDSSALGCPPDWPEDESSRHELVRAGDDRSALAMNCSGKHAAMLWAAAHNGCDLDGDLDAGHPVQQLIGDTVRELAGEELHATGIDGCGAPVLALSLTGLARATGAISRRDSETGVVGAAMRADPWAVGGHAHPNTVVMETVPGLVCKGGAEGVLVLGTEEGVSVAVKILDGSPRASGLVGLTMLAAAGAIARPVAERALAAIDAPLLGGGRPVGAIVASPGLAAVSR